MLADWWATGRACGELEAPSLAIACAGHFRSFPSTGLALAGRLSLA